MYCFDCVIDNKTHFEKYVLFDVSDNVRQFKEYLQSLINKKISGLYLNDRVTEQRFIIRIGCSDLLSANNLDISQETASTIIKMCEDCLSDNAFPGYHIDYETTNGYGITLRLKNHNRI